MNAHELDLILRGFDAELTQAEQSRLDELLQTDPVARLQHETYRRMRNAMASGEAEVFDDAFVNEVMASVQSTRSADRAESSSAMPPLIPMRYFLAAAVVLALAVTYSLWPDSSYRVTVPFGVLEHVELSDGSGVDLSSGSLLVADIDPKKRSVRLTGEAFFDVAEGEPFVIRTSNAKITVLGTRFNVRAWASANPRTIVTVEEGRVSVQQADSRSDGLVIQAGESAVVGGESEVQARTAAPDVDFAWRNGGMGFRGAPVREVFREIERRYDVRLSTSAAAIGDRRITYLQPNRVDVEDVLADVCHTLDLQFRKTRDGYEILER